METVGRYRLERRLGAGSFATVWLGHDDDLDVPVAVKILAENWAGNPDVRQRFLTEARILRRIRDRRIVQVYDIGSLPDGRPYFVMDYINGGSMDDLRKRGVEPVRALRLCAEACRALEVLHRNEVIHRDVTPGNLLLNTTPEGATQVILADLGVAKSMIDAGATMTAGTPAYMAPEQATGAGPLDRRADIYSLTAMTYAMLTGKPPFVVRGIADIITRGESQAPPSIAERLSAPESLDAVMVSGLATNPVRRPPTAEILAAALDVIADQMSRRPGEPDPPVASATVLIPGGRTGSPSSLPPGAGSGSGAGSGDGFEASSGPGSTSGGGSTSETGSTGGAGSTGSGGSAGASWPPLGSQPAVETPPGWGLGSSGEPRAEPSADVAGATALRTSAAGTSTYYPHLTFPPTPPPGGASILRAASATSLRPRTGPPAPPAASGSGAATPELPAPTPGPGTTKPAPTQGLAGPGLAGPGLTGPGPTGPGPTGQGPTGQGLAGQGPTGQGPTGQGPTGQGPSGPGPSGPGLPASAADSVLASGPSPATPEAATPGPAPRVRRRPPPFVRILLLVLAALALFTLSLVVTVLIVLRT